MAHILRQVDRANKILQRFGMLCNFVEMMDRLLIHQYWEVQRFDGVHRLVDLVEAVLGLSDVIEGGRQLLQALNLLLHLVVVGLALNAIHCNQKVDLAIKFISKNN